MRDYATYRIHLAAKRLGIQALRAAVRARVRRHPARPPATVTGTVVLLDRCLGLGDALMISPALRLLEALGPVTVVTGLPPLLDWSGEWLRRPDWAGMTAEVDRLTASGRLLLMPKLGARGLLALLGWRGGVPAGVVWLDPGTWLDTTCGARGAITGAHYTDGALACARALLRLAGREAPEGPAPERLPPLAAPPPEAIEHLGRPLVALAPWATSRIRRWPRGHWSALVGRLAAARPDLIFAMLGSADERPVGEEIAAGAGSPILNLMGRLSLAETTAVIAHSALMVACDNGLLHLALGTGTPLVALFGSTDPAARLCGSKWRLAHDPSLCPSRRAPCYPDLHRDPSCPTAMECLTLLTPERVAGLALGLLEAKPS